MCDDGCDVVPVVVSQTEDNDFFPLALGDNLYFPFPFGSRLRVFLCVEFGRCNDFHCFDDSTGKCCRVIPLRRDGVQGKESS